MARSSPNSNDQVEGPEVPEKAKRLESLEFLHVEPGIILDQKYKILEEVGRGGMATVYKGLDLTLDRPIAIKVLDRKFSQDKDVVIRFQREARAAANLDSAHIIPIYAIGTESNVHYFCMKYVEGRTIRQELHRRMAEGRTFDLPEVRDLILQILSGLEAIHKASLVHRDIKSNNVMIDSEGKIIIMDFGIAMGEKDQRLTQTGFTMGTPEYMAPEQILGSREAGPTTDIYSVGILTYEMITGTLPYVADTQANVTMKVIYDPPTPPSLHRPGLPEAVEALVLKAMAKKPQERFPSSREMMVAIEAEESFDQDVDHPLELVKSLTSLPGTRSSGITRPTTSSKATGVVVGLVAVIFILLASLISLRFGGQEGEGEMNIETLAPYVAPTGARLGEVALSSDPLGAEVILDGRYRLGQTPIKAQVEEGRHQVLFLEPGYKPRMAQIVVGPALFPLQVELIPIVGYLSVETGGVNGFRVLVDGKEVGTTPLDLHPLPAGSREILLVKAGYPQLKQRVTIEEGKTVKVEEVIGVAAGSLSVSSEPSGQRVLLNGVPIGETPIAAMSLAVGTYRLEIAQGEGEPIQREVVIRPGEAEDVVVGSPELALEAAEGRISVESSPTGARVTINDRKVGHTPLEDFVIPRGKATVAVTMEGYFPWAKEVEIQDEAQSVEARLSPMAILHISTTYQGGPLWADALLDGKQTKQTPDKFILTPGPHTVIVSREGYVKVRRKVNCKKGKNTLHIEMHKVAGDDKR